METVFDNEKEWIEERWFTLFREDDENLCQKHCDEKDKNFQNIDKYRCKTFLSFNFFFDLSQISDKPWK